MIKIKKEFLIIAIITLLAFLSGLPWLGILINLFLLIYTVVLYFIGLIRYPLLKKMIKGIFLFFFLLTSILGIKSLVFDVYKIPSSSMESKLYPDDVILVNKLIYGPKLPRSPFEIPWVNLALHLNENAMKRINENWWGFLRLDGTSRICQGDIFVFSLDNLKDYFVVKRCLGLPGDTLNIKNGEVYTNHCLYKPPGSIKNNYQFKITDKKKFYRLLDSMKIFNDVNRNTIKADFATATFLKEELKIFKQRKYIDSIEINPNYFVSPTNPILKTVSSNWNLDNMGPIVIPKKGMEIKLNQDNFLLYGKILGLFENSLITEKNGKYFINGKSASVYKFKLNYYFMMGDNRKETIDSRYWGFLPEINIIGKVQGVLLSHKKKIDEV